MDLNEKIKHYRKASNLTQQGVANMLGITKAAVTAWEKGRSMPSTNHIQKLADILGIAVADLFDDTDNKQPIVYERPKPVRAQKTIATPPATNAPGRLKIPIIGYAQGNYIDIGNAVKKPIGFLDLAPSFANIVDLYAVYITGTSMSPVHEHSDVRLVAPHYPVKIGDTVVLVKKGTNSETETSYIKIYSEEKKLANGEIMLHFKQLNPELELIFSQKNILQMHKVLTYNELLGL